MTIATFVYKRFLKAKGIEKIMWFSIRKWMIHYFKDPSCTLYLHGKLMTLPLSHPLPIYLDEHINYDKLPRRLGDFIRQQYGYLKCIDVGANVGDSIAAFGKSDDDSFLAIEPNPNFNKFLIANWKTDHHVMVLSAICSSNNSEGSFEIVENNGTASIAETSSGRRMERQSLDNIVKQICEYSDPNILKIDTDGHDFEVITGADELISKNLPVVLFECDTIFPNANYVNDCLRILNGFKAKGYSHFILYDNFGNLMGKYSLTDLSPFRNMLFFQLTSDFYYFDILIMREEDITLFYQNEIRYFINSMPNKILQPTAITAVSPSP